MPGMSPGLNVTDPKVVSAFRSALIHQGLALVILALIAVAWLVVRRRRRAGAVDEVGAGGRAPAGPAGRLVLAVGFGNLWLFDGILQMQPKMPLGLPSLVIEPAAESSPHWVQAMASWAGTLWSDHPVGAATATVWIEVGLGLWLLAAPRGPLARLAGLASVGWGLAIWIFGESFGGIFASGQSWLTGAPGAAAVYVVAGALIALPERAWRSRLPGRLTLAGLGVFLIGMAVLQAWPGRGSWQGVSHGHLGSLAGMAESMALTPQPGFLSGWLGSFATFDAAHGFAVNLFFVIALGVTGAVFVARAAPADPPGADRLRDYQPDRLGARAGPGVPRRGRDGSRQHDPVHPAGDRRVPGDSGQRDRGRRRRLVFGWLGFGWLGWL